MLDFDGKLVGKYTIRPMDPTVDDSEILQQPAVKPMKPVVKNGEYSHI